eukprot:TRINITY_DN11170_c0_g1_i1.p1 TRINITY_DN11170_c0_g1~~TRINITY_DN11170_c0_g1_i1.p1  ORF type:complete len:395 (+),score=120.67 TRINITY_DN11170_c0_g1_i1:30-1214(+)
MASPSDLPSIIDDLDQLAISFDSIVNTIQQLRIDVHLLQAKDLRDKLNASIEYHVKQSFLNKMSQEQKQKLVKIQEDYKSHSKSFAELDQQIVDINNLLGMINNTEDFEVMHEDDKWKTSLKKDTSGGIKSFRVEGIIDAPLVNVSALFSEVDLFPSWVPKVGSLGLLEVCEIARLSKSSVVMFGAIGMPWPMAPRAMNIVAFGAEELEKKGFVVIVSKSHEKFPEGYTAPSHCKNANNVAMIIDGGAILKPVSPTQTFISSYFMVNPNISYLPSSFVNFGLKHFAHLGFVMLGRKAETIEGSEYEKRIKDKPELYQDIIQRCDAFFNKQDAKDEETVQEQTSLEETQQIPPPQKKKECDQEAETQKEEPAGRSGCHPEKQEINFEKFRYLTLS